MSNGSGWTRIFAGVALAALCGAASAQTSVNYGRITNVTLVTEQNRAAQTTGAVLGGALGAASGSNRSSGTRALRAGGGVLAGQQLGRIATQRQTFEYTVLIGGTNTIRITTEQAGMRVGDCVSVERGQFNNIRLVDDARCNAAANTPVPANARAEADACVAAKDQLLAATTDADFALAERRMRLLCGD